MYFPNIQDYSDYRSYFHEFVARNRERNPAVSHRFLAGRLNWPSSYLSDLIHGRKKMTVLRALEFARFADLDPFDTERLLHMALQESEEPIVGRFFKDKMHREQSTKRFTEAVIAGEDYERLETLAVFEYLCWSKGKFDPDLVKRMLFTFPELTEEKVERALVFLQDNGIVARRAPGQFEILKNELFFDDVESSGSTSAHEGYGQNFLRFLQVLKGPGCYSSGFVHIPRSQVGKVRERMFMLRNWLASLSKETMEDTQLPLEAKLIYQYDLNLFPILEPDLAASSHPTVLAPSTI